MNNPVYYRINELCIKLVIKTLYSDARSEKHQLNLSHAEASNQSRIAGVSTCQSRCPLSKNIYAHLITSDGQPEPADDLHPSEISQLATHS
jgi:hypothetical protein